ncbi:MAG TPA: WecB/TagA/CpsF family glycosyltransferase [Terriglobales bacterium]|nr:WecB/TagA/CpsF family glycosyltransferase [Terriglobales bacterium]
MAKPLPQNSLLDRPRVRVLGVPVDAIDLTGAVQIVERAIDTGRRGYVCVTGVHGISEAQRDVRFRAVLERAMLVTPDGMPTVWLGRLEGYAHMQRVFGPDLMTAMLSRSEECGHTHFLYGGKLGIADQLRSSLLRKYPGAKIVGTFTPPFRPLSDSEKLGLREKLDVLRPDVVWVGLSTPRQEVFMAEHLEELGAKVMIGVGAAFDFLSGNLRDAPQWMKTAGLQWAHRLAQDPRRLWKRYLINNSLFLSYLALEKLGLRRTTSVLGESLEATE